MSTTEIERRQNDPEAVVAAATAGDESAFTELVERHRRDLQAHTYRILGSYQDAEDLTQETFLRAWRMRGTFQGRSTFRVWLFRIGTNACLSALERRPRRRPAAHGREAIWIEPCPDTVLERVASTDAEPDDELVSKETVELAFLVAVQHLPTRQRAVLIVRDVLGWSAKETASLLDTSVASVESALQRARATLRKHLPASRLEWKPATDPTERERALLRRYLDAVVRTDADAVAATLREDTGFTLHAGFRGPRLD